MRRSIGYFVHHQGRGHAERAADIVHALGPDNPVTLFCARNDIFPDLPRHAQLILIPSLFEAKDDVPPGLGQARTPTTLHCAPLGWAGITKAVATIAGWFDECRPALFISDVSAELAQLARIASVPCVPILQHGDRSDAGHTAAYEGAAGILAPYARTLEQPGRPLWMEDQIFHAGGLGVRAPTVDRRTARTGLGLPLDVDIVLVVAGGGGEGTPAAPLSLGARAEPDSRWITIGTVAEAWHDTPPSNLVHQGWVSDPHLWIAAADRIVSSAGNTTVHMIAGAGRPWIVVPEWRYFAEQLWKARMLADAGAAVLAEHWPASAGDWLQCWDQAKALDFSRQVELVDVQAAEKTAAWLRTLIDRLWSPSDAQPNKFSLALAS